MIHYSQTKGNVTRDDPQQRFLGQHSVAMLEQCCNHSKQCRNNVATLCCAKNRRCESSLIHHLNDICFQFLFLGHEHNFNKYGTNFVTTFGTPYDYNSVMHYSRRAFSKNGQNTIVALSDPNVRFRQR